MVSFFYALSFSAFGADPAPALDYIGNGWWNEQRDAEELALERMDNDDGSWSYAIDPAFDPSIVIHERVIDWVYSHQARFYRHGAKPAAVQKGVIPPSETTDPVQDLAQTEKQDSQGRVWRVQYVDETELALVAAEHEALVHSIYESEGEDPSVETFKADPVEDPWEGLTVEFQPESWSQTRPKIDWIEGVL